MTLTLEHQTRIISITADAIAAWLHGTYRDQRTGIDIVVNLSRSPDTFELVALQLAGVAGEELRRLHAIGGNLAAPAVAAADPAMQVTLSAAAYEDLDVLIHQSALGCLADRDMLVCGLLGSIKALHIATCRGGAH